MSPSLEPKRSILHDLVAFGAEYISQSSGITPATVHGYYMSKADSPDILDAIAALCVTPAHPQSVAIAVSHEVEMNRLQLLISQGGVENPDPQLMIHIRKSWALLRAISQAKSKLCEEEAKVRMFRYLHQLQEARVMRIVQESWPKVDLANRQLGRGLRRGGSRSNQDAKRQFQCMAVALRKAVRIMELGLGSLTTANWTQLLALMTTAAGEAQPLINYWYLEYDWGPSFRYEESQGPPLIRRAVTELLSLPGHLLQLFKFARTPSSRGIFKSTLQVSFLPCDPRVLEVGKCTVHLSNMHDMFDGGLLRPITPTPQRIAPHAVCNIISHLCHHRRPCIGRIGLSAPTCEPCRMWIEQHRSRSGRRYSTRGGDGSWRWPWAVVPGIAERGLEERILHACEEYISDEPIMRGIMKNIAKTLDFEVVAERQREMHEWWSENHGACVFGCMVPDGCSCFKVLYGAAAW